MGGGILNWLNLYTSHTTTTVGSTVFFLIILNGIHFKQRRESWLGGRGALMENLSWREMGFVNCCIELMTAKAAGKVPVGPDFQGWLNFWFD